MEKLVFPDLYCPFPSQVNRYVDLLEESALNWVTKYNLLTNNLIYQRFLKAKFYMLVALTYPCCQIEELKVANDWMSWIFIWDDQCDMSTLKPEVLKAYHTRFIQILKGAKLTNEDIHLSYALSDIRMRMLRLGSQQVFNHFINTFEDYFDGCEKEANISMLKIIPSVETYMNIRRATIGVETSLALTEFCDKLQISDFLRNHDILNQIKRMATNIICWSNDIFSYPKELAINHVHNLVLILQNQQKISLNSAINLAVNMHNQEVKNLTKMEACIPSYGEEIDNEIAQYLSGIHAWISGHLAWYSYSGRYQSLETIDLAKVS
ncbi:terpene synthase family protein [Nostoc sp. FACHB-280]|uniref:terpene synthase family protein n=1 Tax=Nostoc sp. FACHB-280 TaxID=2692839 RepID=UPI00168A5379|nr:terpene synthase [Nostoc sp. FACHB-280]MBD2494751.1 terpene synthase [Nostoc sp. FACHB-280]